jgi:hypothetical protein
MAIIHLYVTNQEHALIKSAAQADSRSINSWCKRVLLAEITKINETPGAIDWLQNTLIPSLKGYPKVIDAKPGEDVIVQRRDKAGKFTKRAVDDTP